MRGRGVADFSRFFVLESIPISWIKVSIIMLINWEVNWHQYMFPCLCILYKTPTKYPHLYHLQHLDAIFNSYNITLFKTRSNWARKVRDMNMSTMSMWERLRGSGKKKKIALKKKEFLLRTGGQAGRFGNQRYSIRGPRGCQSNVHLYHTHN